jgi:peroxiredoxin
MGVVEALRNEFVADGVEILGITDEEPAVAKEWLARYRRTVRTLADRSRGAFGQYGVDKIPVVVIVDRRGIIVARFDGLHTQARLRQALEKALGSRARSSP